MEEYNKCQKIRWKDGINGRIEQMERQNRWKARIDGRIEKMDGQEGLNRWKEGQNRWKEGQNKWMDRINGRIEKMREAGRMKTAVRVCM